MKKILNYLKSKKRKTLLILGAVAVLLIGAFGGIAYRIYVWWSLPEPIKYGNVLQLNNDVWTEAERQRYYHLSQGSQLIPYDWFVALEQGDNERPFSADDNMTRFRFIPDSNTLDNPDRLPIGFAKDDPDPITGVIHVGISCATCHTAQMMYKGTGIRIDGAPGLINFDDFLVTMLASLEITKDNRSKFDRFAKKVLRDNYNSANAAKLKADVTKYIVGKATQVAEEKLSDLQRGEKATKGGFGRIDALGAGGNRLYRQLDRKNLRTLDAPVKAVPLWYTHEYNWVQTNGSIRQPMARNIIEALAVNASLVFPGDKSKDYADRYISSVRLNNMFEMETMIQRFKAPIWPVSVLGPIDAEAVKRGEVHYQKYCSSCHEPQKENTPEPGDAVAIKNNKTFFVLRLFPVDKLNTDPADAVNFARRRLDASKIGMGKDVPGAEIIGMVLSGIIQRRYDELKLPPEKQEEWNGYRDNLLRACEAYPARPLAGVWANAPYLHNGSVPNLYQLLLPPGERDKTFCTGDVEFDPINVGYVNKAFCGFRFDTSIKGNSNAGHQYGTSLTHAERMDLIEYLKALTFPEKDYPLIAPQPACP